MVAVVVALSAVAMIAVALYHLARLVRLVRTRVRVGADLDVGHAAMGIAMAAMLLGATGATRAAAVLALAFAVAAGWFGARAVRSFVLHGTGPVAPLAQPAVGCAAMVLMLGGPLLLPGSSVHVMGGTSAAGSAVVQTGSLGFTTVVVAAATLVLLAWSVRRWQRGRGRAAGRPGLALGCQAAMNVTTVAMLALM